MTDALILGNTSNALSIARNLKRSGVFARCLAQRSSASLKSSAWKSVLITSYDVVSLPSVLLSDLLVDHHGSLLIPTNDGQVKAIEDNRMALEKLYIIGWHVQCGVSSLLSKLKLSQICAMIGVPSLPTIRISNHEKIDVGRLELELGSGPWLVKPEMPMGPFKVRVLWSLDDLERFVYQRAANIPCVVQPYLQAMRRISLAAISVNGVAISIFRYRKDRAWPDSNDQGTVFSPEEQSEAEGQFRRLLDGLAVTGPVAAEFLVGDQGDPIMIDVTIARFEYCVEVAHGNGVPLASQWFSIAVDHDAAPFQSTFRYAMRPWCDTERDPRSVLLGLRTAWQRGFLFPLFPLFSWRDIKPFLWSFAFRISRSFWK